jgi:hypothetical protein
LQPEVPAAAVPSAAQPELAVALDAAIARRRELRRLGYLPGALIGAFVAPAPLFLFGLLFGAALGAALMEWGMALALDGAIYRAERQWRIVARWLADDGRCDWIGLGLLGGATLASGLYLLLAGTDALHSREPVVLGAVAGAACLGTLGSYLALVTGTRAIRTALVPRQRVFVRLQVGQTAVLAVFVIELALTYLKRHPEQSAALQVGGGVAALSLAGMGSLKKLLPLYLGPMVHYW